MFRCKECQAEYEIKPEYCDCGNDTFDEITPKIEIKPEPQKTVLQNKPNNIQKTMKSDKVFFEPISTIIFSICIVLSFIIVFFIGNPEEKTQTTIKTNTSKQSTNIPNINKIWNNALPKAEEQRTVVVPKEKPIIPQKTTQTIQNKKTENISKTITKAKTVAKQQTIPSKQQATSSKQQIQPTTKTTPKAVPAKQNTQQTVQPQQQTKTTTNPVINQPQPTQNVQTRVVNQQELANYKINLRNKIAHKINFANVIGDGTCIISFTISNSGILQNRKFKKQSNNFTLNDVVYNAIMQTPSYNPPPSGYQNEVLSLTVKMYNGNYEVSLN